MDKEIIRKKYKENRLQIKHKGEKSKKIAMALISTSEYESASTLAVYASLAEEVDTSPIIDIALKDGKTVLLPKIEARRKMNFFEVSPDLIKNTFGIKEPQKSKKYLPEEIDLIIMPIVCADENRNRIGFGGGYYDRYLSIYKGRKIGICFDEQISSAPLPCSEHDIKPDMIVSDKRIIKD